MPTTLTSDQQRLANTLSAYNTYLNPNLYNPADYSWTQGTPATGGAEGLGPLIPLASNMLGLNGTVAGKVLDFIDPLNSIIPGIGIFNSLFGKKAKAPEWKPYATADGRYVWTNPANANPVPLSEIPGASIGPSNEYVTLANQVRAMSDLLPYYANAISAQKLPEAQAQLAADAATTGPRLALQQALQEQYGPIFDQLAAESNMRKAMSSANVDKAVMQGPGKELVAAALEAAKQYDPEYFNTRAQTSDSLAKLLGQATGNLGSGLSNTERDEVSRGLALEGSRRGTANAPSNLNTVSNAMQFGAAGRQREQENQNQLSKAIQASTAFLPASRSNVDVFQVATGKSSAMQNQDNRFNTNTANSDASSAAQGLLNTGNSIWNTNTNIQAQKDLLSQQQNDWTKQLSAVTGALGSMGSLMLCWVAREVYGPENPQWLQFREWLINKAPRWFFNLYKKYGQQFAKFISDKPKLKKLVKLFMDSRINNYTKGV